jgi:hypothetical protein
MVDPYLALLTYLRATSPLRTLLGGNYVYTPELPGHRRGDQKNVTFRNSGGQTAPYLRAQDLRVTFRCYGESAEDAYEVYGALYDRLHDTQNFIVGDVGFHGATEEVPGVPTEDPVTNWPFVFAVYSVRVATVPVSGDAGGS